MGSIYGDRQSYIGVMEHALQEMVSLAYDQPCRTDQQQHALLSVCDKLDYQCNKGKARKDHTYTWAEMAKETRCKLCRGDNPGHDDQGRPRKRPRTRPSRDGQARGVVAQRP